MSDTFLPGSGFDTYEEQDKVLMLLDGSPAAGAAVRVLQQQGFAVAGAAVRLRPEQAEAAQAARRAAKALGIECVTVAPQPGTEAPTEFGALCKAADRLGISYIAAAHRARLELSADGTTRVLLAEGDAPGALSAEAACIAALPQSVLARLLLPLGEFAPADIAALAAEPGSADA